MRDTEASFWVLPNPSSRLKHAMRLGAVVLGVGLVMAAGAARAQEDEEDDSTFEEKIIQKVMSGLGGTSMDNAGIEYRERSPLVVPPKINLPPPASAASLNAPNWPKDPDASERRRMKEMNKNKVTGIDGARPLTPSELAVGKTAAAPKSSDPVQPGNSNTNPILSPTQLGFTGFNVFGGGNKGETAPFTGEPPRATLIQPPSGYQTPSPNYAYGTGPKEILVNKHIDIMSGKEVSQ